MGWKADEDDEDIDESQDQEYWVQTRRPLVCLVFLIPLLAVYEAGVAFFGSQNTGAVRNGADFWMRGWLMEAGLKHAFLLPAIVVAILIGWQFMGRHSWRVSFETLAGMLAESLLFAFLLLVAGQFQAVAFQHFGVSLTLDINRLKNLAPMITYLGAGLYEEVLFRLCLLPSCYGLFRLGQLSNRWAAVLAVLATSLLFSYAHYVGSDAYDFTLFSFSFRALAGMFFAALFVLRGFGITVGCHAAYDLLVGVLMGASA